MNFRYFLLPLWAFFTFLFSAHAQNPSLIINYVKSDSLFVCGNDTFTVKITNAGGALAPGATLNVLLPSGLGYAASTVSGAAELDVSDPQNPKFTLPAIGANSTQIVQYQIHADCRAAMVLDGGGLFISNIAVTAPNANAAVSTTSIPVETGLMLIQSIHDLQMSGEKGDTLNREICLKNTRLGKIGNLHFEDQHAPGLEITIPNAAAETSNTSLYTAEFTSTLFQTQGNHDPWLDLGESVCITEKIIIQDCGIPEWTNTSLLRAGWGCGPGVCRYDSALAFIRITPSTKVPNLVTSTIWNPPLDICGLEGSTTGVAIVNIGNAEAKDISLKFYIPATSDLMGIAPGSFRMVSSAGTITPVTPNLTTEGDFDCNPQAHSSADIIIPSLLAKDSMKLLFDLLYCNELCVKPAKPVSVELFYRKPCPVNGFVSDTFNISPVNDYGIQSNIYFNNLGHCLFEGVTYQAKYSVVSHKLNETNGVLHVQFDLPAGFELDPSCPLLLEGHAPIQTTQTPGSNHITKVNLDFQLPFQQDSALMTFCFKYHCDSLLDCQNTIPLPNGSEGVVVVDCDNPCIIKFNYRSLWTANSSIPADCGIGDCNILYLIVDAPCKAADPDPLSGVLAHLHWKYDVRRNNRGFLDSDDDRQMDAAIPAPASEIRLDRYLAGDTMRIYYCAVLDSGSLPYLPRRIFNEILKSDFGGPEHNDPVKLQDTQFGFVNGDLFRFLQDTLRIHYHTGEQVTIPVQDLVLVNDKHYYSIFKANVYPYVILDEFSSQHHVFDVNFSLLHLIGLLPKPDVTVGDSIFITSYFKLGMNFNGSFSGQGDPPLVGFRTSIDHRSIPFAWNLIPARKQQYSGYILKQSPVIFSIKPCEPSVQVKKFRYSIRIARENMFPFEVRPLARLTNFQMSVPQGLIPSVVNLSYLALQDSFPLLANVPLFHALNSSELTIDFSPIFQVPLDEGFSLSTNIVFDPDCMFSQPEPINLKLETTYNGCLNGSNNVDKSDLTNTLGYFSNHPELQITGQDSVIHSIQKIFNIPFTLFNPTVSPAPHSWIRIGPGSANISDFHLYKTPGNQEIIPQNGFYNLNQIIGFTNNSFVLTGRNLSCNTDSVKVYFGWNCNTLTSASDFSCFMDSVTVLLNLEKPELELDILHEPDMITLCDTSEYYEFEIYNAKTGYAYDLFGTVHLPQGLEIVPGSSQIYYPPVGAWATVSDPELLSGNLYRWDINAIQPSIAANGLPGIESMPSNTVRIRFKTLALCGFVANSQNIYGTYGKEACGKSTNILNKPGELIQIQGLTPTYDVLVAANLTTPGDAICGGEQEFSVQLAALGAPGAEDSVYVYFPAGISYVQGSYMPGPNAPAGPPTMIPGGFRLPLPAMAGGGIFDFRFKLHYGNGAGCSDQLIQFQTRVHSLAFCQSTGANCDIYVSTGEYALNLHILHPELNISAASVALDGNNTGSFTVSVTNNGQLPADGNSVEIWADTDQNGMVSASDVLLLTLTDSSLLTPGGTVVLMGSTTVDPTLLCHLIAVLPLQNNCICNISVLPISSIQLQHVPLVICNPAPQTIGTVQQTGFTYQWNSEPGLSCTNCPMTVFTPDPGAMNGDMVHLQLVESDGVCMIQHQYEIDFGVVARITSPDTAICKGATVSLTANPAGQAYSWVGTGLTNPTSQVQVLSPDHSNTYTVVVNSPNGCTSSAEIYIEVRPADSTYLPVLEACEGSIIPVFGSDIPAAAGIYHQSLSNVHGCDSTLFQEVKILPKAATESFIHFCEGVAVQLFDTTLNVSGKVCKTFTGANGCDSTHCITATATLPPDLNQPDTLFVPSGQVIELGGYTGFAQYFWNPPPVPSCQNCGTIEVTADSTGYHEYVLTVLDGNGCSDTVVWRFVVFPPCDPKAVMIPNAFTPNGDGNNDVFRPIPSEGGELIGNMSIYDRWGEKVYENSGVVFWDGTIKGQPAPSDVYVYIIEVDCPDGKGKRVGEINLLR